jgi:bidirectional [NiFe] hydrogenase diaphorase subunit
MVHITMNGLPVEAERGSSLLELARFYNFPIPTLCHEDGLNSYGACRLCLVEIGEAPKSKLVAACGYRVEEGMKVRTNSMRVQRARRLLLELYVATCPQSKRIQDLASEYGVRQCRYQAVDGQPGAPWDPKANCIQCGLCVRICSEQMMAGAIGFSGRGKSRHVSRPFGMTSEQCRQCGACLYACPVCELRCQASTAETLLCNGCLNFSPVCFQSYSDAMCFLEPCHACELSGPFRHDIGIKVHAPQDAGQKAAPSTGELK